MLCSPKLSKTVGEIKKCLLYFHKQRPPANKLLFLDKILHHLSYSMDTLMLTFWLNHTIKALIIICFDCIHRHEKQNVSCQTSPIDPN